MKKRKEYLKIGFLIWKRGLGRKTGKYEVVYTWPALQKSRPRIYTKQIYNYIQILAENDLLINAVQDFRKKFPIRYSLQDLLDVLSLERTGNTQEKLPSRWNLHTVMFPSQKATKAAWYIAKFMIAHHIVPVIRRQLETIFYFGFVDERIMELEEPIQLYIRDLSEDEYIGFCRRPPIAVYLNSSRIKKEKVFKFLRQHWEKIEDYFKKNESIENISLSDDEMKVSSARRRGWKYREIKDTLFKKGKKNERKDEFNLTQMRYRTNNKIKHIVRRKNITSK